MKNGELYSVLAVLVFWAGMFGIVYLVTSPTEMEERIAEYVCKEHDGVYRITTLGKVAHCNDNSRHEINSTVIIK